MALNIPLPKPPGEGLTEGLNIGSQMMARFLQNKIAQQEQDRLGQMTPYEIALKQAQANEANASAGSAPLKMDLLKAQIEATKSLAKQRDLGLGGGTGAGLKEMYGLVRQIVSDNPGTDITKANQIASAYLNGDTTLPDGSPVPMPSGITQQLVNQVVKRGSTTGLVQQDINARQAHAEIDVMSNLATHYNKPYANTFFNMSPAQIADQFKTDDASQTRLGEFIAGQQLQNEIAQLETKLAMGQPGITNTQELMKLGMQQIDAKWPHLSAKAREVAQQRFVFALNQGLKARQAIGIGAAGNLRANKPMKATGAAPRYTPQQLQAFADDAIAKGADPAAVQAEMAKLMGGG